MRPICIIDDDDDIRAVMTFALEFEGMKVLPFKSGITAFEELSKVPDEQLPLLIVLDYMMPDMDGVEFIHHARKFSPHTLAKIPTVLSTARLDLDSELPSGIRTLSKPIDLMDFLELVKSYVTPKLELSL